MKDNFLLSRGVRVKEERMRLSLTQQQCADACGVSRVQWGKYERDVNGLDGEVLKRFIAIGADGAYILGGVRNTEQGNQQLASWLKATDNVPDDEFRQSAMQHGLQMSQEQAALYAQRKAKYDALIGVLQNFDDELFEHTLQTIDYFENSRRLVLENKAREK